MIKYALFIALLTLSSLSSANLVIHFMPTEDPGDDRLTYIIAVLKLALKKTEVPNETIELKPLPAAISFARSIHEMKRDVYPNYFTPGGVNIEAFGIDNLKAVDFPLDHGLLSYRICFVSPMAKEKVSQAKSIAELRQFTIVQGSNWPDIPILNASGFKVIEVPVYTSLFKMVMSNRADLFCRGINELHHEYEQFKSYGNLLYDQSFVLIYPMPYKLYFNQSSTPLITRIEAGLKKAQADGSLKELFMKHHEADLTFAQFTKRKQFHLKSGYENLFSENYKRYLYDPFSNK